MSLDCTTGRYDALYSRWLADPGRLLDLAQWKPGERLLDLCGGTGAVSLEALRRGASPQDIVLLDLNPRLPAGWQGVRQLRGPAEQAAFLLDDEWGTFDVVVCRQAMGYLRIKGVRGTHLFTGVRLLLRPGGRFAFNTFAHPRWAAKTYKHESRRYLELSGYLGRQVVHLQAGWGVGIDLTTFRWHRDHDIRVRLQGFDVREQRSDRSVRWVCTKEADHDE